MKKKQQVGAGTEYLAKERLRELVQGIIEDAVRSKTIKSQNDLDSTIFDMTMAINALRMVPFEVWQKKVKG